MTFKKIFSAKVRDVLLCAMVTIQLVALLALLTFKVGGFKNAFIFRPFYLVVYALAAVLFVLTAVAALLGHEKGASMGQKLKKALTLLLSCFGIALVVFAFIKYAEFTGSFPSYYRYNNFICYFAELLCLVALLQRCSEIRRLDRRGMVKYSVTGALIVILTVLSTLKLSETANYNIYLLWLALTAVTLNCAADFAGGGAPCACTFKYLGLTFFLAATIAGSVSMATLDNYNVAHLGTVAAAVFLGCAALHPAFTADTRPKAVISAAASVLLWTALFCLVYLPYNGIGDSYKANVSRLLIFTAGFVFIVLKGVCNFRTPALRAAYTIAAATVYALSLVLFFVCFKSVVQTVALQALLAPACSMPPLTMFSDVYGAWTSQRIKKTLS